MHEEEVSPIGQRDDQLEQTRQRILAAAVELFERQGFGATPVDAITAAAGVSRRTFFYHFPTKEDAVLVDHDEQLDRLVESIEAQPAGAGAFTALWAALEDLGAHFDSTEAVRLRHRLVVSEPVIHARSLQLQSSWDERIADVLRSRVHGQDANREAAVLAAVGLACLRSCARSCVSERSGASLREALREARHVLVAATADDGTGSGSGGRPASRKSSKLATRRRTTGEGT